MGGSKVCPRLALISALSPLFLFGILVISAFVYVLLQTEECEYYKHVRWSRGCDPPCLEGSLRTSSHFTKTCTTLWYAYEERMLYDLAKQTIDHTCPAFSIPEGTVLPSRNRQSADNASRGSAGARGGRRAGPALLVAGPVQRLDKI